MITDYSKLSMTKLVNAYQNYINDAVKLAQVLKEVDCVDFASIRQMYEITLVELNSVLTEIIKRLNLKGEQKNG